MGITTICFSMPFYQLHILDCHQSLFLEAKVVHWKFTWVIAWFVPFPSMDFDLVEIKAYIVENHVFNIVFILL